jgi:hypothetical protein
MKQRIHLSLPSFPTNKKGNSGIISDGEVQVRVRAYGPVRVGEPYGRCG